jgi:hypothetical protein
MKLATVIRLGVCVVSLGLPSILEASSEDRTIWLQPGHCIVVGSQQVCSVKSGENGKTDPAAPKNRQMHICKNGITHESDPMMKGWGHVVVTVNPDGKKLGQEVIKTYGPLGKAECEADVAKEK